MAFWKIDGPGKWNQPHLHQGPLFLGKPTKKDTYGSELPEEVRDHQIQNLHGARARVIRELAFTSFAPGNFLSITAM